MISTLKDRTTKEQYAGVLGTLEKGAFWSRDWANRQYVGMVLTAMCHAVMNDEHEARRFAVLRVMEVFLEHRHDLLPATEFDRLRPRNRIATLAVPDHEAECKPWLDVLEYMQLRNWTREGVFEDRPRSDELRVAIADQFSTEVLVEIDESADDWWIR